MLLRPKDWQAAILLITGAFVGCYSPYFRTPNFAHPGTAAEQRADAERFDPYPDPDAGPPVLGGRPPGFTRPLTDTEWARRYVAPPGALQPSTVISIPAAPVTNPFAPPPAPPTFQPAPPPVVPLSTKPSQFQPRNPY
jgi:hypothetical protein